jgi:hypothetical protein
MATSSVTVVTNSMMMRRYKPKSLENRKELEQKAVVTEEKVAREIIER